MVLKMGRFSIRSLLGTNRLLGHGLIRVKCYAYRRILGPVGHGTTMLLLCYSGRHRIQGQYANASAYGCCTVLLIRAYVVIQLQHGIIEFTECNNKSEVIPCRELQNLNHLNNQVTSSSECILACR